VRTPQSPVLHPLSTSLLQLRLSLALAGRSTRGTLALGSIATHTSQTLPRTCDSREGQVSRVGRDHNPCVPRLVTDQCSKDDAEPGPIGDVPHPFGQALGFQVLAGALQVAIGVSRTADAFEPELDDQGREVEDEPGEEAAGGEEEVHDEEEQVDAEGDHVHAIEDGRVAGCQRLESFLVVIVRGCFMLGCIIIRT
jgi:hypothetical protein